VKNIAVIPARGGSKRIPRKNIQNFHGKPMIHWTILAAKKSNLFDEIIISTEDKEIAQISEKLGARVLFERPANLADDFSTTHEVMLHAVQSLIDLDYTFDYVCCLYPCSPFIQSDDLKLSLDLIESSTNIYIYPVTEFAHPIHRAIRLLPGNNIQLIDNKTEKIRTQDLELTYHDAAQFYWGSKDTWLNIDKMHSNALGYPIPNWRVVDIDNMEDLKRAESIFKSLNFDV
jgi:pseudaminic acid cytidylyltransferase